MRTIFIIVYTIVMTAIGLSSWVFGDTLNRMHDRNMFQKGIYIYVFNDKTQLWDRAREETLKNATCEKLHTYVVE